MAPNNLTSVHRVSRWIERAGRSRWRYVVAVALSVMFFGVALSPSANDFVRIPVTIVMVLGMCLVYCAKGIPTTREIWQQPGWRFAWLKWLVRMLVIVTWLFMPITIYTIVLLAWPTLLSNPVTKAVEGLVGVLAGLMLIGLLPMLIVAIIGIVAVLFVVPVFVVRSAIRHHRRRSYRYPQ